MTTDARMNSRLLSGVLALTFLAAPTFAKTFIDYDTTLDLTAYETWSYLDNKEGKAQDPLMDSRIVKGLEDMLSYTRLAKVDANPDLLATYTVTTAQRTQYSTTHFGMGTNMGRMGRGGWGSVGMSSSQTTASTFTDGTLIVDVWDPKTKQLVWRGTSTSTLKGKPDKIGKQIEKAFTKLRHDWDKIVKKAARAAAKK